MPVGKSIFTSLTITVESPSSQGVGAKGSKP